MALGDSKRSERWSRSGSRPRRRRLGRPTGCLV